MQNFLQQERLQYQPKLPKIFQSLGVSLETSFMPIEFDIPPQIERFCSHTFNKNLVCFNEKKVNLNSKTFRVGVILSGGQAPGGHNVISGIFDALQSLNAHNTLIGFLGGPQGLITNDFIEINQKLVDKYRNIGGFDIIGSGRTKLEGEEVFKKSLKTCQANNIDALVIIGGDDSNTNACLLADYLKKQNSNIQVIGCPKTIDGDLKNEFIETSFGFDTACKVYSELIGNISKDILSSKKYWHFIRLMGRSASHITLECALKTRPNKTLISEEIEIKSLTFKDIVDDFVDLIEKRFQQGYNFGLVLIPEGVIEFIPEMRSLISELNALLAENPDAVDLILNDRKQLLSFENQNLFFSLPKAIQRQLLMDRDPHGNVQVSRIETEKLFLSMIEENLSDEVKKRFSAQTHFFGYEGRCADPSNFDADYCYSLGYTAVSLIAGGYTAFMASLTNLSDGISNAKAVGVPLTSMMNIEKRHGKNKPVIKKALVELESNQFCYFAAHRDEWAFSNNYNSPGPIQYFGSSAIVDSIPEILKLERREKCLK